MSKQTELAQVADTITVDSGNVGIGAVPLTSGNIPDITIAHTGHGLGLGYQGATLPTAAGMYTSSSTNFGQAYGSLVVQSRTDYSGYSIIFRNNGGERMRIDAAGRVTMPYQPAFHAGLSTNTSSLTSGTTVVFNSVYENRGNHYNTSTGVFTAPVTGFYSFTTRMLHQGVSNGHAVDSQMQKNNSSSPGNNFLMQRYKYQADYTGHTGYLSEGTSGMIYLAAGDNFRVKYGGSQNSVIHGNPAWTYFCGHLVS